MNTIFTWDVLLLAMDAKKESLKKRICLLLNCNMYNIPNINTHTYKQWQYQDLQVEKHAIYWNNKSTFRTSNTPWPAEISIQVLSWVLYFELKRSKWPLRSRSMASIVNTIPEYTSRWPQFLMVSQSIPWYVFGANLANYRADKVKFMYRRMGG